ncbi:MAG TPA: hypothetical protein VGK46_06310 [Saprospiraceae bacterium]
MKSLLCLLTLVIFLAGCTKDIDILHPDPFFPNQETFVSPLFIEVFNVDGTPLPNSRILLGGREAFTDANGLVYLNDAIVGESAYLTVEKDGFFPASRRFYPAKGKAHYVKIIMLSNARIAFFNAKDGAILPVEDHATIKFPQGGYVLGNGDSYDGIVLISAKSISADDPDLSSKMPGDLVGINNTGQFGALGSLGMLAVEMKTPEGEEVKFDKGVEAIIEMIIPSTLADKVPATIPLWYFDIHDGIWKQEGMAERVGDRYKGSVSHFSFWNCDVFYESIFWRSTYVFEDGSPVAQAYVCITIENLGLSRCAYTDLQGSIGGYVAANEILRIKVLGRCGQEIYNVESGPFSTETSLGPVTLSDPNQFSQVSGYAVDCDLKPLVNGYVKISTGKATYFLVPDITNGYFEGIVSSCTTGSIGLLSYNPEEETFSKPLFKPFAPEVYADTLFTCDLLDEYAVIEIEGFPIPLFYDSLSMGYDKNTFIRATVDGEVKFGLSFRGNTVGQYYSADESTFRGYIDLIQIRNAGPLSITVEKYGKVGEYIKGTFQGKVTTSELNFIPEYEMKGSFSVLREK